MKPKNLKEFKALKKRYESITLEEIKEDFYEMPWDDAANHLTGFGDYPAPCTLCESVKDCYECVYDTITCRQGKNKKTYNRIDEADTPIRLRNAYRARAKHMKTLLNPKS